MPASSPVLCGCLLTRFVWLPVCLPACLPGRYVAEASLLVGRALLHALAPHIHLSLTPPVASKQGHGQWQGQGLPHRHLAGATKGVS